MHRLVLADSREAASPSATTPPRFPSKTLRHPPADSRAALGLTHSRAFASRDFVDVCMKLLI